jgi:hypothetical protein
MISPVNLPPDVLIAAKACEAIHQSPGPTLQALIALRLMNTLAPALYADIFMHRFFLPPSLPCVYSAAVPALQSAADAADARLS